MQSYPTREEALTVFDAARREHEDFLSTIPRERMADPDLAGGWSVKDVIAHVMAYRNSFTNSLEALAAGKPKPATPWPADLKGDDPVNEWIYEHYRDVPLDEVLREWEASFDRMRAAFVSLPDEILYDPDQFDWTEGRPLIVELPATYLQHFNEEHKPGIEAWLAGEKSI